MEKQNILFLLYSCFFLLNFLSEIQGVRGSYRQRKHLGIYEFHPKMLFVFGDSYVDTGNSNKSTSSSWMVPYGITFPGKPDGRYSDGLILTNFLADSLGLKSPLPYVMRKNAPELARSGINFAFGGTGVFNTLVFAPNMTTQIDFLQNLVNESAYTKSDLQSSLSLVSITGNNYSTYLAEGGSFEGFAGLHHQCCRANCRESKKNSRHWSGKSGRGALQPLGCLPIFTAQNNFQQCNATVNTLVELHNTLLQQAVAKLNNESKDSGAFVILDIYGSFTSVLNHKDATVKFENLLKPCCMPMKAGYFCGTVDAKREKMYTVCDNPKATFFWDTMHPTQAGWRTVFSGLNFKF